MKIGKLFDFINSSLESSLPAHVQMPQGVEPMLAFTSHLSRQGQILAYSQDGREFFIEQTTPCLFVGFRPENEGYQSFIKGQPLPEEYHIPVIVIPMSMDPNIKRVFVVFHVADCLASMQSWYDRTLVRHYVDDKCVWAGFESNRTPNPTLETVVEKRPVGEREWLRVTSKPVNPFLKSLNSHDSVGVKKEEWSPSASAEATVGPEGIIPIESGKKPKSKQRGKKVAEG